MSEDDWTRVERMINEVAERKFAEMEARALRQWCAAEMVRARVDASKAKYEEMLGSRRLRDDVP